MYGGRHTLRFHNLLGNELGPLRYFVAWISSGVFGKVEKSNILPGFKTDHSLITLDIDLSLFERGPGFWKLNCKHLNDPEYIKLI